MTVNDAKFIHGKLAVIEDYFVFYFLKNCSTLISWKIIPLA